MSQPSRPPNRFAFWSLLVGAITLAALAAIVLNLRAVSLHRALLYRALALEVGQTSMNYILAQDDFPVRRNMIVGSIALVAALLIGIVILLRLLELSNRRLQEGERQKSEMISTITHNANHYLAVIKGRIDLLSLRQEEGDPLADLRRHLSLMDENARSLTRLIESLNQHELLTRGRLGAVIEKVDLAERIRAVVAGFAALQASAQVRIVGDPPAARVRADRHLLEQVLMNLIHNAIKFSPPGGEVRLGIETAGAWIRTWVCDQGPGVPAADRERIFTPFVRLQPATRGAGLGLANARRCVRLLGGELMVGDAEPGPGACFAFTLPAWEEQP